MEKLIKQTEDNLGKTQAQLKSVQEKIARLEIIEEQLMNKVENQETTLRNLKRKQNKLSNSEK